jgi:eukaryotic-like serine/threonine-protein kinase
MTGTDGATSPFWSPDGQSIAFFADRWLKRIDLRSGAVTTICKLPDGLLDGGGTWGADDAILFETLTGIDVGVVISIPG